jgi:uncharacterized protein YycO
MSEIKLLFTRRRTPFSGLIRLVTWSVWSHVDIVVDSHLLIGAVACRGVVHDLKSARLEQASRAAVMTVPCDRPEKVIAAARQELGQPYDWLGILGLGLHRDWQEDDRWFCSELVSWAFRAAGQPLFDPKVTARVTPQHLWMLPHPKERLVLSGE